jgi:formiminotetrahydrofolate cyclodeaminase
MLAEMYLKEFLDKTASNSPVPGGGSIAALSGAISAALTEMVANLTIGKKKYIAVEEEMKEIAASFSEYRSKLVQDIDRDSDAFNEVMAAFKLPKETEEEAAVRNERIEAATKMAALVPLEVARDTYKMMDAIEVVVEKGNQNAVTDGAVAAMMARTAVLSALYNVEINLGSLQDKAFAAEVRKEAEVLRQQAVEAEKKILMKVKL